MVNNEPLNHHEFHIITIERFPIGLKSIQTLLSILLLSKIITNADAYITSE